VRSLHEKIFYRPLLAAVAALPASAIRRGHYGTLPLSPTASVGRRVCSETFCRCCCTGCRRERMRTVD
jgi:hypothetical protein